MEINDSHENVGETDCVECPICDREADIEIIQCEECKMWYHYSCLGLPRENVKYQ